MYCLIFSLTETFPATLMYKALTDKCNIWFENSHSLATLLFKKVINL